MNDLLNETRRYLAEIGDAPPLLKAEEPANLPLFLRQRFRLHRAKIFGRTWRLALEAGDWDVGTPNGYRRQVGLLANSLNAPVVLVLPAANATLRNRLVRLNVPFIVPGTQIFLPMSYINLKERYGQVGAPAEKQFSPTAQVLVLCQVLRGELEDLSSKEIAARLGCSAMMITKARSELESRKICEVERVGKEARMLFPGGSRAVWERALSRLASPVAKRRWVQWNRPVAGAKIAGISALSRQGLLSDDDVPTYALKRQGFHDMLEGGEMRGWPGPDGADACVECWHYDPGLLSSDPVVDTLSLYLSLRHDHDERVQGELESMLEKFKWR